MHLQQRLRMQYTVWSRGRLIGTTDLAFLQLTPLQRSGWFIPLAYGHTLMPEVSAGLIAMRAWLHRKTTDAGGNGIVQPSLHGSTLFADIAEAYQRAEVLELQLRHSDGSIAATSDIGIQDTEAFLALHVDDTGVADERLQLTNKHEWLDADDADWTTNWAVNHDMALSDATLQRSDAESWSAPAARENERYQIHVRFVQAPR